MSKFKLYHYKDIFLASYSSKKEPPLLASSCNIIKMGFPPTKSNFIITGHSSFNQASPVSIPVLDAVRNLPWSTAKRNKSELVIALHPTPAIAYSAIVINHDIIQQLANASIPLGITLFHPKNASNASLHEQRQKIFDSRKRFNWNNRKYIYSNSNEKDKLICINLSFSHANLIPSQITKMISLKPDVTRIKGQQMHSKSTRTAAVGSWLIRDAGDPKRSLHRPVEWFLKDIYDYRKAIRKTAEKYSKYDKEITIALNACFHADSLEHYRFSPIFFQVFKLFGIDLVLHFILPFPNK